MAMLETLKSLVYQKNLFAEQARLVLDEDENFDRIMFLEDGEDPVLPEGSKDPLQNDNTEVQPEGEQPMPIQTQSDSPSVDTSNTDSDIMSMELNTSTDTVSNVVPSPPPNAADQIETTPTADSPNGGDIMNEEIGNGESEEPTPTQNDSPDGEQEDLINSEIEMNDDDSNEVELEKEPETDDSNDIMNEEIGVDTEDNEVKKENAIGTYDYDVFNEDISIGGEDTTVAGEPTSTADKAPDVDMAPEDDNTVTAAVKEKVNDATDNSEPEPSEPDGDISEEPIEGSEPTDDGFSSGEGISNKEELIKKVSSITKSNIDLMAQIQNS